MVFVTDADPAMDAIISQTYETTYPIYCIFHISENLLKNTKSKLSDQYENFVHDFYQCCNSLYEDLFYERWTKFTEKYSNIKDYLMRALYSNWWAWACAFTSKVFTAVYKLLLVLKVIIILLNAS